WNEPDNPNTHAYGPRDLGNAKQEIVIPLLLKAFEWVRSESPIQPLTSGIWLGNWSSQDTLRPVEQTQIAGSDVISFHNYTGPAELESRIHQLARYERPMLCTEFMARGAGSTFIDCLPVLHRHRVGALCWGLVKGKTQTHLPWDSWQRPYVDGDPNPWFHEVFHPDGSPYDPQETALISELASSRI
ncbi:MAG TPA: glycosyl hydrolase, partial [Tepidisphaeraceae bacterium]|nr:glycosyl hydrolase [Tepidisphaeraceae bacterium]